jgi:hypothetical protein
LKIAHTLIDGAQEVKITQEYQLVNQIPIHASNESVLFPALAIPVETKIDYECPDEHLETLQAMIPQVHKLIVVGWRAAETPFLSLLAENLQGPVQGLVVAADRMSATETANRLKEAGVAGSFRVGAGGFSDLVVERRADDFLRS